MSTLTDPTGNIRHAAGTSASRGGQFAAKHNAAPTGALLDDTSAPTSPQPTRAAILTAEAIRASQEALTRVATSVTQSYRIDATNAEDIVQDSWVHLLERDERRGDIADRVGEKSFLGLVARKYAANYGNDHRFGLRSEDFSGRRTLRAKTAEIEATTGRKMTKTEYEALADEIRESFPAGRRPRVGYHVELSQLSLDVPVSSTDPGSATLGDTLADEGGIGFHGNGFDQQEDAAALALHNLENQRAAKDDIRRDMWRILSTRIDGAPQPVRGSLDATAANRAKRTVAAAGGALELATKWSYAETTPEQEEALFAPFGPDLDNAGRQGVFNVLESNPTYADRIWISGISAATR